MRRFQPFFLLLLSMAFAGRTVLLPVLALSGGWLLSGCGGSGSGSSSAVTFTEAEDGADAPDLEPLILQGNVRLTDPVARARVRVIDANGVVVGKDETSEGGSFDVRWSGVGEPPTVTRGTKAMFGLASGLEAGELRVLVTLEDGTILAADAAVGDRYVAVTLPSTILSMVRAYLPGLTPQEAEQRVRGYLGIPDHVTIESLGGEDSLFSVVKLLQESASGGTLQHYLERLRNQIAASVATRGATRTSTPLFSEKDDTDALNGIGDDKRDNEGSSDPDLYALITMTSSSDPDAKYEFTPAQADGSAADPPDKDVVLDEIKIKPSYGAAVANAARLFVDICTTMSFVQYGQVFNRIQENLDDLERPLGYKRGAKQSFVKFGTKAGNGITWGLSIFNFVATSFLIYNALAVAWPDPTQQAIIDLGKKIDAVANRLSSASKQSTLTIVTEFASKTLSELNTESTVSKGLRPTDPNSFAPDDTNLRDARNRFVEKKVGQTAEQELVKILLGRNGSLNLVQAFYNLQSDTLLRDSLPADPAYMGYELRNDEVTRDLRNFLMRYVHSITLATYLDGDASYMVASTGRSAAASVTTYKDRLEGSTEDLGANGLSFARRLALQQAPPRFGSDRIWADARHHLIWSKDYLVKKMYTLRSNRILYGDRLKPTEYGIDGLLPKGSGWRLPTIAELRTLPGFAAGQDEFTSYLAPLGLAPLHRVGYTAVLDRSLPDPSTEYYGRGRSTRKGQVRIYDFADGSHKDGFGESRDSEVKALWVLDLRDFNPPPSQLLAWPDAGRSAPPSWWPQEAYKSNIMLAAGLKPDRMVVIANRIANPAYDDTKPDAEQVEASPKNLVVVSAIGYWKLSNGANGQTRGIVADMSGRVAWATSDPDLATVDNTAQYTPFPDAPYPAPEGTAPVGFVSPWHAVVTFHKATGASQRAHISAHWLQGVAETPDASIDLQQAADASYQVPPVPATLNISPRSVVWTNLTFADGQRFHALLSMSDRTVKDRTANVTWQIKRVQFVNGQERGTVDFPPDEASISNSGFDPGTGTPIQAGIFHLFKRIPPTRMRVIATDPESGRSDSVDVLLQVQ